jgi:glycerol-3-phosphate dehydrogenase (NAD(P)+)
VTEVAQAVSVLGAGSWGSALALHALRCGHAVSLWTRREDLAQELRAGRNERYLPGVEIPKHIRVETSLEAALEGAQLILLAVPSMAVGELCISIRTLGARKNAAVIGTAKGLERTTGRRLSEVMHDALGEGSRHAQLLGPSHAEEVARGLVTAIVLAGDPALCAELQPFLSSKRFRVYTNEDLAGVEYSAALKNVLAIAAGICDGLGLGDNARGALLTRGIAEIARLGVRLGGKPQTFYGLAGMGDVITTCLSRYSRNRNLGERLGRGEDPAGAQRAIGQVVEGVATTETALELSRRHDVAMPISEAVGSVLFDGVAPREAIESLMQRELRSELEEDWSLGPRRLEL